MRSRDSALIVPKFLHEALEAHLFPGDGLEAAALLLCARVGLRRCKLIVRDLVLVPHDRCKRRPDFLSWPGEFVEAAIDRAEAESLTILAAHSHPGGLFEFSDQDDASDTILMPSLFHATGREPGSAIMVPGGAMRARLYDAGRVRAIDLVTSAGDDIAFWWNEGASSSGAATVPVAFTSSMTDWLSRLSVCVIGVSGTGSIVAEQLGRLGFGEIILIDFDKIEHRNLNRILNSTMADAEACELKVEMFSRAVKLYRPDTVTVAVDKSILSREAVLAACEADVMFSCVDTAEGRHIADRIAAFFAIPLFDVGVSIPTRKSPKGPQIAEVCGRIDYVQPGGATLSDRGVFTPATLEAEYLARSDPEAHQRRVAEGYLRGLVEQAPAVVTLNMRAASSCVMEFIARAFPFRHASNSSYARTIFLLADGDEEHVSESSFTPSGSYPVGAGIQEPLLGLPALAALRYHS